MEKQDLISDFISDNEVVNYAEDGIEIIRGIWIEDTDYNVITELIDKVCDGKDAQTSEKDLRVCEVSNSLPLILGLDNPYPLRDVLERLKWATNYLLHEKNYDGHSYEELNQCVRRANEIIATLNGNGC